MNLEENRVLVLNRVWQAIGITSVKMAFCQLCVGVATPLDIQADDVMSPVKWEEWLKLPIREGDNAVQTVRGPIRCPTVIVLANYVKVPKKRPRFCARTIRERDGNRCQYTGKSLSLQEGSIDHVLPRSRGGKSTFENCVWAARDINLKKGDKLPQEVGLRLLSTPRSPKEVPVTATIKNSYGIRDWKLFLIN